MSDNYRVFITDIIGLIGPDVIENGALERKKYEEEAIRGKLAHYRVTNSQRKRLNELIQEIVQEEPVSFGQQQHAPTFFIMKKKRVVRK